MSDTEPISPPSVTFNKETRKRMASEVLEEIHRAIENVENFVREADSLPSMHDLSYEETAEFVNLMFYQAEWLRKKVGVQIDSRIAKSRNIFLLSPDKFKEIYKRYSPDESDEHIEGVRAAHSFGRQIIVRQSEDQQRDALFATHELFHAYAEKMIRVKEKPQGDNSLKELSISASRLGYQRDTREIKFGYFNEAVTELMRIQMIHDYSNELGNRDLLEKLEVGYPQQVVLFDLLFEKAAETLHVSRAHLDKIIFQGYFTGSQEGFRLLHKVFGEKVMKEIANYDERKGPPNSRTISEAAGLDYSKFEERMALLISGKELQLCGGGSFRFSQDQIESFRDSIVSEN